jgi:hypothetical protein
MITRYKCKNPKCRLYDTLITYIQTLRSPDGKGMIKPDQTPDSFLNRRNNSTSPLVPGTKLSVVILVQISSALLSATGKKKAESL